MTGREIAEQQNAADSEASRIMCEPVINAVLRMWSDRINSIMERRGIGWEEALKIHMLERADEGRT
jgi:hypothetical protein